MPSDGQPGGKPLEREVEYEAEVGKETQEQEEGERIGLGWKRSKELEHE